MVLTQRYYDNNCSYRWLLEHGCDPGVTDASKRAPFDDSLDKECRNTFRRFMAQWPDKYDYKKVSVVCVIDTLHSCLFCEHEQHILYRKVQTHRMQTFEKHILKSTC